MLVLGGTSSPGGATSIDSTPWSSAHPEYIWSFPRDHSAHPAFKTEWWYFTGHLAGSDGRRFGYQFTFFRVGLRPATDQTADSSRSRSSWSSDALILGHASVVDLDRGEHRFSEVRHRTAPFLGGFPPPPDSLLAWSLGPPGTDGKWTLRWNGNGFDFAMRDDRERFRFRLETRADRPLVLHGPNGYSQKSDSAGAASHYYSFTRSSTRGTLEIDGVRHEVTGSSWMDKEFSSAHLGPGQVGWDWFSLQLEDGRDLMLYRLRRADGSTDYARGSLVPARADEGPRVLAASDWVLEATGKWKSPRTGAEYPSRWSVTVDGSTLIVVPEVADQENVSQAAGGLFYWEGAVRIEDPRGLRIGQGYVELVGYGKRNRPPI